MHDDVGDSPVWYSVMGKPMERIPMLGEDDIR